MKKKNFAKSETEYPYSIVLQPIFIFKGIQHRSDERTKINQFSPPTPRKPNAFPLPPPPTIPDISPT